MNTKCILVPALMITAGIVWAGESPKPHRDSPVGPSQKPYQPTDNETVEVTPPSFVWAPSGRDATYVLQVSRDERFSKDGTRTFDGLKRAV